MATAGANFIPNTRYIKFSVLLHYKHWLNRIEKKKIRLHSIIKSNQQSFWFLDIIFSLRFLLLFFQHFQDI